MQGEIGDFDRAIRDGDEPMAVQIWGMQRVVGGDGPDMVVRVLIRLQHEIDGLKAGRDDHGG